MKITEVQTNGTDFFSFFGIHQVAEIPMLGVSVIKKFKPGGFQEAIDIEITEDEIGSLLSAAIQIERTWLGNAQHLNPFGTDIAKSFLNTFIDPRDHEQISPLVDTIADLHGEFDKIIKISGKPAGHSPIKGDILHFVMTTLGKEEHWKRQYNSCTISFANITFKNRTFLEIGVIYPPISPGKQERVY